MLFDGNGPIFSTQGGRHLVLMKGHRCPTLQLTCMIKRNDNT
jgi:hypothetical protein